MTRLNQAQSIAKEEGGNRVLFDGPVASRPPLASKLTNPTDVRVSRRRDACLTRLKYPQHFHNTGKVGRNDAGHTLPPVS